jgi:hypothetical protein
MLFLFILNVYTDKINNIYINECHFIKNAMLLIKRKAHVYENTNCGIYFQISIKVWL